MLRLTKPPLSRGACGAAWHCCVLCYHVGQKAKAQVASWGAWRARAVAVAGSEGEYLAARALAKAHQRALDLARYELEHGP